MKTQIDIRCSKNTAEKIAGQIRLWAKDIIESLTERAPPDRLKIFVYHGLDELQNFFRKEKEALGIVSEGEAEFIAIHEAWRGYPRIHICSERIKNLPEAVVLGAVQHELAHAVLHGRAEFYNFRFSRQLISASEALGFDMQLLQQCVYMLSIALKDGEVVSRLVEIGFQYGQIALLEHMLADTRCEHEVWHTIRHLPPQRKIAVASFLKILLPVVILAAMSVDAGRRLQQEWKNVYDWLSETERLDMMHFATGSVLDSTGSFQDRLEQTALKLITDPRL
ncbi:MAG: hypothetical protein PVF26_12225 [Desulfobacterales bacterium]|jgi:hypothetical protein